MIRYVTKWDGTLRTLENIKFVLKVVSFDNRYDFAIDSHDEDLYINIGDGRGIVVPKDSDITIWQDGTIEAENDSSKDK